MDILLPFVKSEWSNNELRFCLRAIERFAVGYDRVVIVGDDPGFLVPDHPRLKFFTCPDIFANKEARIAYKILWAFENTDISDDAVYFNDDHVLLQTTDVRKIPHYQQGDLSTIAAKHLQPGYRASLRCTAEALIRTAKPTGHYDIHVPMIFNRQAFLALKPYWEQSRESTMGFVVKSIYANATQKKPGPMMRDCKIIGFTQDSFDRKVAQRWVFSYGDAALQAGLKDWFWRTFPAKSGFERSQAKLPGMLELTPAGYYPMRGDKRQVQGLNDLLGYLPYGASGVEIGSYAGESAEIFLSSRRVKKLICIDPWQPGYYTDDQMLAAEKNFDEVMSRYPSQVFKLRMPSMEGLKLLLDRKAQFDFVYIDGNHELEFVLMDIRFGLPLVKFPYGVLCGHDYSPAYPGVVEAVRLKLGFPDIVFADGSWLKFAERVET